MHAKSRNLIVALAVAVMTLGMMPGLESNAEAGLGNLFRRNKQPAGQRVSLGQRFSNVGQRFSNWRQRRRATKPGFRTPTQQRERGQGQRQAARTNVRNVGGNLRQAAALTFVGAGESIAGNKDNAKMYRGAARTYVKAAKQQAGQAVRNFRKGVGNAVVGNARRPVYATRKAVGRQARRAWNWGGRQAQKVADGTMMVVGGVVAAGAAVGDAANKHVVQPINNKVVKPTRRAVGTGLAYGEVGVKAGRVALGKLGQSLVTAPKRIRKGFRNMGTNAANYVLNNGGQLSNRSLNQFSDPNKAVQVEF